MKRGKLDKLKPVIVTEKNIRDITTMYPGTPLLAYKVVRFNGAPPSKPYHGIGLYKIGGTYYEPRASTDVNEDCARGLHVATKHWIKTQFEASIGFHAADDVLLTVSFTPSDIAAIPVGTRKFRLFRMTVVSAEPITWSKAYKAEQRQKRSRPAWAREAKRRAR